MTIGRVLAGAFLAVVGLATAAILVLLYFTAPRPLPESELIGHWVAEPEARGTADFYADGTFQLDGLSFDPFTGKDAIGVISGSGTWEVRPGRHVLDFTFDKFGDTGDGGVLPVDRGLARGTLGWGDGRRLYFSDGEEIIQIFMHRTHE